MHSDKIPIIEETIRTFDSGSSNYLDDDEYWGDDTQIVYRIGRLLNNAIKKKFPFSNSDAVLRILYAGCGPGALIERLLDYRQFFHIMIAIDISQKMLNLSSHRINEHEAKYRVILQKEDLLKTSFPEKSFNMIICVNNTLGNLPHQDISRSGIKRAQALKEFNRVLDHDGYLVLSVYNAEHFEEKRKYTHNLILHKELSKIRNYDFILQLARKGASKHYLYSHWFREKEFRELLEVAGFKVEQIEKIKKRIIAVAKKK